MKSIYVIANNENVREELYRADIKKGDKVRMNDRYYVSPQNRGKIFKVLSNPTMLCGSLRVSIERCYDGERWGAYSVDGLTKVFSTNRG